VRGLGICSIHEVEWVDEAVWMGILGRPDEWDGSIDLIFWAGITRTGLTFYCLVFIPYVFVSESSFRSFWFAYYPRHVSLHFSLSFLIQVKEIYTRDLRFI
jgi:hypothetical protein